MISRRGRWPKNQSVKPWPKRRSPLTGYVPGAVLDLIAGVQVRVVERACLPHFPDDFQPALAQGAQSAGMTLALGSKRFVISFRPRTELAAQVGPEMHGVAQGLVTLAAQMDPMTLAGLKTHRGGARQTLQGLRVETRRGLADFQTRGAARIFSPDSGQQLEESCIRMLREQPADFMAVFDGLGLQQLQ